MMSLYEISNKYRALVDRALEEDEISEEVLDQLDVSSEDMEEKIRSVAAFIKNMEAEEEAVRKAMKDMQNRAIRLSNKIDRMKRYLKDNMEKCNIKEVKTPQFNVTIKENPPKVIILDEERIPMDFMSQVLTLNKSLLKNSLINGYVIPGARLEKGSRIDIR